MKNQITNDQVAFGLPYDQKAQGLGRKKAEQLLGDFKKHSAQVLPRLKKPESWTRDELDAAMRERMKSKSPTEQQKMMQRERRWFDHNFGTSEVKYDETGKMIQPDMRRRLRKEETPVTTREGEELDKAFRDLLEQIEAEEREGSRPVDLVRTLQNGLNVLSGGRNLKTPANSEKRTLLKTDGVLGPKTAFELSRSLIEDGRGKLSEATALGRFKEILPNVRNGKTGNLAKDLEATFAPLIGRGKSPKEGFQPEGLALQDTLNELGAGLKDDGIVGPKTQQAFQNILKSKGDDEVVGRFAKNLGFDL